MKLAARIAVGVLAVVAVAAVGFGALYALSLIHISEPTRRS